MDLPEQTGLTVSIEEVGNLFGPGDTNLKAICEAFNVKAIYRDGILSFRGEKNSIEKAFSTITELKKNLSRSGNIDKMTLKSAIKFHNQLNSCDLELNVPGKTDCIVPKSPGQDEFLMAMKRSDIVFSIGPAGTGKTFLAVACGVTALCNGSADRLIITRPAVEAGENLGFLPGDLQQKIDPYLRPVYDALKDMLTPGRFKRNIDNGTIEIAPLAYMRGRTLNNAFIILDEAQNTTTTQLKMFLTRLGQRSRAVVTGDITQIDLQPPTKSGLIAVQNILAGIKGVEFVYLNAEDVVRHPLVQRVITAFNRPSENEE